MCSYKAYKHRYILKYSLSKWLTHGGKKKTEARKMLYKE